MDSKDSSKHLAQLAGAGDHQALDALFQKSQGRLRRLLALRAGGLLHDNELDDLVQEAYLEATRQFADYSWQGPDSFFRWLATVALNRLANLRRMAQAKKRSGARRLELGTGDSSVVPRVSEPVAPGPGPRTISVGREQHERMDRALNQMSAADREVIALSRVQGLGLQEIATKMGRTKNAVALLLSRALRKLQALIDEDSNGNRKPE